MGRADANQANLTIPGLKDNVGTRYLIAVVYSDHNETYDGSDYLNLALSLTENKQRQVEYNTCHVRTGFILIFKNTYRVEIPSISHTPMTMSPEGGHDDSGRIRLSWHIGKGLWQCGRV